MKINTPTESRWFPEQEIRVETRDGVQFVTGLAIPFNRWSVDLGGFRERVAPTFVDRTLDEGAKVLVYWSHDRSDSVGNTRHPEGGAAIQKRDDGLYFDLALSNLSDRQRAALERRDVEGMSFAFRTIKDEWKTGEAGELDERTLIDGRFSEISLVTEPAYPDTKVALRSRDAFRGIVPAADLDALGAIVARIDDGRVRPDDEARFDEILADLHALAPMEKPDLAQLDLLRARLDFEAAI